MQYLAILFVSRADLNASSFPGLIVRCILYVSCCDVLQQDCQRQLDCSLWKWKSSLGCGFSLKRLQLSMAAYRRVCLMPGRRMLHYSNLWFHTLLWIRLRLVEVNTESSSKRPAFKKICRHSDQEDWCFAMLGECELLSDLMNAEHARNYASTGITHISTENSLCYVLSYLLLAFYTTCFFQVRISEINVISIRFSIRKIDML